MFVHVYLWSSAGIDTQQFFLILMFVTANNLTDEQFSIATVGSWFRSHHNSCCFVVFSGPFVSVFVATAVQVWGKPSLCFTVYRAFGVPPCFKLRKTLLYFGDTCRSYQSNCSLCTCDKSYLMLLTGICVVCVAWPHLFSNLLPAIDDEQSVQDALQRSSE